MQADEQGQVTSSQSNPMTQISSPLDQIQVTALDVYNIPSPHVTFSHMLGLYQTIQENAQSYDGFVITHGTDTLEETAYFLDTLDIPKKPIVLTGAMRSSNELGSDGVYNYLSALRVAADEKAADKGVLLVMNDEIHAAKFVTKTHTLPTYPPFKHPHTAPLALSPSEIFSSLIRLKKGPASTWIGSRGQSQLSRLTPIWRVSYLTP